MSLGEPATRPGTVSGWRQHSFLIQAQASGTLSLYALPGLAAPSRLHPHSVVGFSGSLLVVGRWPVWLDGLTGSPLVGV